MDNIIEKAENENQKESQNLIPRRHSSYSSSSSKSASKFSIWNLPDLSGQKKLILLTLCIADVLGSISESFITPFFPIEARNRGVSSTVSGLIFGVLPLVQFLVSPLASLAIKYVGSRCLFIVGVSINACGCLLFSLLTQIPIVGGGVLFTIGCFVLRIFMGIAIASYWTAAFTIMTSEFEENVSFIFGFLEMFIGLGMVVGPGIGGLLYGLGGFMLPFLVLGIATLCFIPMCYCLLPTDNGSDLPAVPVFSLLRVPKIFVIGLTVIMLSTVWASFDPIVEPRLSHFHLTPAILGLTFLLLAASYIITALIFGWICDQIDNIDWLIVLGLTLTAGVLMMFGPSPLVQPDENFNSLPLNVASMILIGISFGIGLVPTYECVLDASYDAGFVDNMPLFSAVGALWGSFFSLGEVIGPILSGALIDHMSFPWCLTVIAGLCLFVAGLLIIFLLCERLLKNKVRKTDTIT